MIRVSQHCGLPEGAGEAWLGRRPNLQVPIWWSAANAEDFRKYPAELVAFAPQVILATGSSAMGAPSDGDQRFRLMTSSRTDSWRQPATSQSCLCEVACCASSGLELSQGRL